MSVAKTLREAAEYIRVHGWSRALFERQSGAVCMYGACGAALNGQAGSSIPMRVIDAVAAVTGMHMIVFNDDHCESSDDAIAALEIAADIAECEERHEP